MTSQTVPGSNGVPFIGKYLGVVEFMKDWQGFFLSRQKATGSDIFRANLGTQTIAILDPRPMAVVMDTKLVKKRYGFGAFRPHPALVGHIVPTVFENGVEHMAQKAFWMDVQRERAGQLYSIFDDALSERIARWEKGPFIWDDEMDSLWADVLFRWLIDADGPAADVDTWMGDVLANFAFGSKFNDAKAAWERLLALVRHSPGFDRIAEIGASHQMNAELSAKTVTFSLGFNGWAGITGLARSAVADLTNHRDQTADLDRFVLEVARMHPPVNMLYGETLAPMDLESHGQTFHVRQGELLMGVVYNAQRDPEIFQDPTRFMPDRFADPVCRENLYWAGAPDSDMPGVSNHMCSGRDFVLVLLRKMLERLIDYEWTLQRRPVWSELTYPSAGGPMDPMQVSGFRRR